MQLPLLVFAVSVILSEPHSLARSEERARELERVVNRSCDVLQCVSYEFSVKCSVTDSPAVFLVDCVLVPWKIPLPAVCKVKRYLTLLLKVLLGFFNTKYQHKLEVASDIGINDAHLILFLHLHVV